MIGHPATGSATLTADEVATAITTIREAAESVHALPEGVIAHDAVYVALQHLQCDVETALAAAAHHRRRWPMGR